jgi:hypothetical protein
MTQHVDSSAQSFGRKNTLLIIGRSSCHASPPLLPRMCVIGSLTYTHTHTHIHIPPPPHRVGYLHEDTTTGAPITTTVDSTETLLARLLERISNLEQHAAVLSRHLKVEMDREQTLQFHHTVLLEHVHHCTVQHQPSDATEPPPMVEQLPRNHTTSSTHTMSKSSTANNASGGGGTLTQYVCE